MTGMGFLVKGDMFGDKIVIGDHHVLCANCIYKTIRQRMVPKYVISVCGGSGSGKSEIASLLGTYCIRDGLSAYVLSCDNYPKLPPRDNEARREELFMTGGYQALEEYLGTEEEINFERLSGIVHDFLAGKDSVSLRIIDNPGNRIYDDNYRLEVSDIQVLILEGTWSGLIEDVSLRVFLDVPLEITLEHRRLRGRDPLTAIGETVVQVERFKLDRFREERADLVVEPRFLGDCQTDQDCCNLSCQLRGRSTEFGIVPVEILNLDKEALV